MGVPRDRRRWRVILVPAGPETEPPEEGRRLYQGPRDRALEYYEQARQGYVAIPDDCTLVVTDGAGLPVYAS